MPDLKPCPFCGSPAHIVWNAKRYVFPASPGAPKNLVTGAVVYCENCPVQMFFSNNQSINLLFAMWNRRADNA